MDLSGNGSRKRRRASTVIRTVPPISDTDDDDHDDSHERNGPTAALALRGTSTHPRTSGTKFIVGLDFGTTFSSVSYIKFDAARPPTTLRGEQIKSVCDWPNNFNLWRNPDVPSESWYLDDKFYWGYRAREEIKGLEDGRLDSRNRIIHCAKLLLVEDEREENGPRTELRRTLTKLRKSPKDVIKDYLREVLKHSKSQLVKKEHFADDSEVELVFCVPAGWPVRAIRIMQEILLEIVREINFGVLLSPLYILNEPEAAAACMLEAFSDAKTLNRGDVFIVCDAGGGTVDTITYRVRREHPFRVDEVVAPSGSNCGSSYVNQALKKEVIRRIKGTVYESLKGPSFEYIIEHDVMNYIEYNLKRRFDPADGLDEDEIMVVHGLTKDGSKGFGDSTLYIPRKQIPGFFRYSLDGVSKLIDGQIRACNEKGRTVSKILLVGGFSTSPVFLNHIKKKFKLDILKTAGDTATAVSHGAVFRALTKADGPSRTIQSNFGFLQIEQYNKKLPAHVEAPRTHNLTDGRYYVYDVLDWIIKKNHVLKTNEPFRTQNYQTFELDEELVIKQRIYVSDDDDVRDHYQLRHRLNRNAEVFGLLQVDLQQVKDEGLLETKSGPRGDYYEIHYELGMEVDGRNLSVKLFCPPGGSCRGQKQFCISAAFIPGTE